MPKMDGLELVFAVKERFPELRFILLTSYGGKVYMKQAIKLKIDSFIEKPIHIEEITREIQDVLAPIQKEQSQKNDRRAFLELECIDGKQDLCILENIDRQYFQSKQNLTLPMAQEKICGKTAKKLFFKLISTYIQENFNNSELTLSIIASKTGYAATYLCRLFKNYSGLTINDYLLGLRLKKAKELLFQTDWGIYRIGNAVGYNTGKYFVKFFQKIVGLHPNEYRKQVKMDKNTKRYLFIAISLFFSFALILGKSYFEISRYAKLKEAERNMLAKTNVIEESLKKLHNMLDTIDQEPMLYAILKKDFPFYTAESKIYIRKFVSLMQMLEKLIGISRISIYVPSSAAYLTDEHYFKNWKPCRRIFL